MIQFPNGYLLIHEFATLTEAHAAASRLAEQEQSNPDFRLIEVAPTAGGAWVCAFGTKTNSDFDVVQVDETVMNAFLSLGPKAERQTAAIGIVESNSIAKVFQSALHHSRLGLQLLEIRVKRSGPIGAYAFFGFDAKSESDSSNASGVLPVTRVALVGDYRRFFV